MNISTLLITSVYFVLIGDRGQVFFFLKIKNGICEKHYSVGGRYDSL